MKDTDEHSVEETGREDEAAIKKKPLSNVCCAQRHCIRDIIENI